MKTRLLPSFVLSAIFVASCAPATATVTPAPIAPTVLPPTVTFPTPVPTLEQVSQPTVGPTQSLEPTPFPVATSRGPNLEATDPTTVNLASGQIHFVEFFRFT